MPSATDYSDPETPFPRLQARIQKVDKDAHWLTIWLREKVGEERHEVFNRKRAGSFHDAHEIIKEYAKKGARRRLTGGCVP
jgi:hypothetical protein